MPGWLARPPQASEESVYHRSAVSANHNEMLIRRHPGIHPIHKEARSLPSLLFQGTVSWQACVVQSHLLTGIQKHNRKWRVPGSGPQRLRSCHPPSFLLWPSLSPQNFHRSLKLKKGLDYCQTAFKLRRSSFILWRGQRKKKKSLICLWWKLEKTNTKNKCLRLV